MKTECQPYWCPTAGDYECCGEHGGFDVCCDAPELHVPVDAIPECGRLGR